MPQEHLSPEVIAMLQRETGSEIKPPEVKHFQYVVVIADDTYPEDVPATISKIVDMIVQRRATVSDITSSLVVGLLGVPFPKTILQRHAGGWLTRYCGRSATGSESFTENVTEPSATLAGLSDGHTAR